MHISKKKTKDFIDNDEKSIKKYPIWKPVLRKYKKYIKQKKSTIPFKKYTVAALWLMFYGHFCAHGRSNGLSDLQR